MSDKKIKVCMLVRNNFIHDTRVLKEAQSLSSNGYQIQIIAIKKIAKLKTKEVIDRNIKLLRVGYRMTENIENLELVKVEKEIEVNKPLTTLEKFIYLPKYLYIKITKLLKIRKLIKYFFTEIKIIKNALNEKADIYHAHDLNMLMEGFICAKLNKAKLIYDSHELFVERNATRNSMIQRKALKIMEGFLIKRSDAVITVSESIADYLAGLYNIKAPYLIRNSQPFEVASKNNKFKEMLDLPDTAKVVLYAGRITFNRGLENLILSAKYLSPKFFIILMGGGTGQYIEKLKRLIKDNLLMERVFILLPVASKEVLSFAASADLGIIPTPNVCLSYYYGASNKLFHYMMAGLPILASDHPEKRKIILENEVGDVIDPEDPKSIANKINSILEDEPLYDKYSNNSLKAAQLYNWETEEQKLLNIYADLSMSGPGN